MKINSIGRIRSQFKRLEETPEQGINSAEVSRIILSTPKLEELRDCKEALIIYWMHLADRSEIYSKAANKGVFAIRGPCRPNPIGISVVKLLGMEGNSLLVKYLDALDGTPVLDVRPFIRACTL